MTLTDLRPDAHAGPDAPATATPAPGAPDAASPTAPPDAARPEPTGPPPALAPPQGPPPARPGDGRRPGRLRQLTKSRKLKHYNRLVVIVAAMNLWLTYPLLSGLELGDPVSLDPSRLLDLTVANLTLAVLIRQQYVINALFWLATRAPTSWPLGIRWTLGKVYHFGGIHTSAATAATVWFTLHLLALVWRAAAGISTTTPAAVLVIDLVLVGLLVAIVATALPWVRQKCHDRFELVHRLGGWSALVLFWAATVLSTAHEVRAASADGGGRGLVPALLGSPQVWALAAVTLSVALPWLRLKRVPVDIETPSSHVAVTRFNHGYTPFAGSSTAVSRRPLREWHSFANVPAPGEDGFRLTISRAGDWTGAFIDDKPSHVWVKGICTAGVANIEVLFRKVVYVATGSGIGPCLPHLLAQKVPAHLIWATRNPRRTYGDALVDEIMAAQPDALVWDTDAHGKPDLVELAYDAVRTTGAEAVICISNPNLTWKVVEGAERRGIPAYGAIWDS